MFILAQMIDRAVNIVKNTQIQKLVRLRKWRPRYVCSTSSGGHLIMMVSDDEKHAKVVRYFSSSEKQTLQFDDKDRAVTLNSIARTWTKIYVFLIVQPMQ